MSDPPQLTHDSPVTPVTPVTPDILAQRRAELLGLPLRPRDTVVVIILAAVADFSLFNHPGGAGFAALLSAVVVGLILTAPKPKNFHRPLFAILLLLIAASIWNFAFLVAAVACISVLAFAVRLHQPDWTITETAWAVPQTLMLAPLRFFGHLIRSTTSDAPQSTTKNRVRLSVFLIPLITCGLFLLIFIAANPVIEHIATRISVTLGEWLECLIDIIALPRFFFWLAFLLLFAALIRPAVSSHIADLTANWRETLTASDPTETSGDDFVAVVATLISVNVLFLAFNGIDSVYLYFKADLPAGITYSDYSRNGCFWLTMALTLATAVIGAMFKSKLNFHPRASAVRALTYIWALQNLVLAVGALRRLQMYVDYNGLTRLRIVGIYGIVLVIVGLILMVKKVHGSRSFAWLIRRDLVALWVGIVVLALTPRDLVCWKYNVAQIMAGNLRPLTLLHGQPMSPESLPPLTDLLEFHGADQAETDLVRHGVAALLGRNLVELESEPATRWSEWQYARRWAMAHLNALRDRLDVRDLPHDTSTVAPAEEALRNHTRQWW